MCFRDKGVKVGSSNRKEWLAELEANHESEELRDLKERGFKVIKAKHRKRVKTSEVQYPVKVTVTAPNCDWTLTVSWEHFLKKGGNCRIVKRFYK